MKYKLNDDGCVIGVGFDPAFDRAFNGDEPEQGIALMNWRYDAENKQWIYSKNMIVPQQISKLQAVKRLLDTGRYTDLMTALDRDPSGVSRILFEAASTLSRDSNMVSQFAAALGFSDKDTDEFFVEADKIMI